MDYRLSINTVAQYCLKSRKEPYVGNDRIRGVKVCGNRCVTMWEHKFSGRHWTVCSKAKGGCNPKDVGYGKVSSYKITAKKDDDCYVRLCQGNAASWVGKCCTLVAGSYNSDIFGGRCPRKDDVGWLEIIGFCYLRHGPIVYYGPLDRRSPATYRFRGTFEIAKYNRPCRVRLCEHPKRSGKCCWKTAGYYDIDTLRDGKCPGDDTLSKVYIVGKCSITLYEHPKHKGKSYTLVRRGLHTYRDRSFPNDRISSFKIRQN